MEQSTSKASLATASKLTIVLRDFKIGGKVIAIRQGPIVTTYEFLPEAGIKAAKIANLTADIARCLAVRSARVTQIPESTAVGIELPNAVREVVTLAEMLRTPEWTLSTAALPIILGKDMLGKPVVADLARMPHLLIAGTTGSGKSIGIHSMIASLLYRFSATDLRMILVDPKQLEMSQYARIPHLATPVITEPSDAVQALKWTLEEMEHRYRLMSYINVRNMHEYNTAVRAAAGASRRITYTAQVGFDADGDALYETQELPNDIMPYIVVIIDEVADLMITSGKEVEVAVQRLAQMARAAGIHLILATQRPSVDVITGTIKANFPSRISYQLQSKIDSRTIIGQPGAEALLGNGDLLLMLGAQLTRIQGAFVDVADVQKLVDFRCIEQEVNYIPHVTGLVEEL
jgi:S-DNA-T family DNA segregation ATPase FtsK/SpoIIIE